MRDSYAFSHGMKKQMHCFHVTSKGIDQLRWLNERMSNKMTNEKISMHFSMT
jgi:hypothetical protein